MSKLKTDRQFIRSTMPKIREHWIKYDPIGVFSDPEDDWPIDEYDGYLGRTFTLLVDQDHIGLKNYIEWVVSEQMGMVFDAEAAEIFVSKLEDWFKKHLQTASLS